MTLKREHEWVSDCSAVQPCLRVHRSIVVMYYSTVVFSHASTKDYTGARKDDDTEPATVDRSRSTASAPLRAELRKDSPIDYKYWSQRYQLFNKWECGVILDETAWYSVTPEGIAQHHATRCSSLPQHSDRQLTVLDLFCGAGGNAIQFALRSLQVVTFDIMRRSVDMVSLFFLTLDFLKQAENRRKKMLEYMVLPTASISWLVMQYNVSTRFLPI